MFGKGGDTIHIALDGLGRIVAQLEVLFHPLAQRRHGSALLLHHATPSVKRDTQPGVASTPRRSRWSHCCPEDEGRPDEGGMTG